MADEASQLTASFLTLKNSFCSKVSQINSSQVTNAAAISTFEEATKDLMELKRVNRYALHYIHEKSEKLADTRNKVERAENGARGAQDRT